MTAKQELVWGLYSSGHGVTDIAKAIGRSKSTVSAMISRIKSNIHNPAERVRSSAPCVYSSSCFTCPLRDCILDGSKAVYVNLLPGDMEVRR